MTDRDSILAQYGAGYVPPQLEQGDGETLDTQGILNQYSAHNTGGIPGWMRGLAERIKGWTSRMYEALMRRGYNVQKHPDAVVDRYGNVSIPGDPHANAFTVAPVVPEGRAEGGFVSRSLGTRFPWFLTTDQKRQLDGARQREDAHTRLMAELENNEKYRQDMSLSRLDRVWMTPEQRDGVPMLPDVPYAKGGKVKGKD